MFVTNSRNVKDNVYMDSILFVEDLHVAVCDSFDLGSLLVLLLVILFSKPKKTHRGVVLGYRCDATHVTEQEIHRAVATKELIEDIIQQGQAVVTYR